MVDANDPRPAYQQIADDIRALIEAGTYAAGDRLPSGRELAKRYDVAPMTVQQALRELREQGLIVAWQGRGVFVRGASGDGGRPEPTMAAIMARLDAIYEDLQRLQTRVAALERRPASSRRSRPAAEKAT